MRELELFKKQILDIIEKGTSNRRYWKNWESKIMKLCQPEGPRQNRTHPQIWGSGWYAILDDNADPEDAHPIWYFSPKEFFDEKGFCLDDPSDFWDLSAEIVVDGCIMTMGEYLEDNGFDPDIPEGFHYCIESGAECLVTGNIEEQKDILRKFGYIVDNVPPWAYNR